MMFVMWLFSSNHDRVITPAVKLKASSISFMDNNPEIADTPGTFKSSVFYTFLYNKQRKQKKKVWIEIRRIITPQLTMDLNKISVPNGKC